LPVRRGAPAGVGGLVDVVKSPAYATGVGLVKYGAERLQQTPPVDALAAAMVSAGWGQRLGQWFREVF
jgi:cell division protein FtsA